ncbi:MAG: DinB family protein [Pyrinomonadaceae bacterium]
METTEQLRELFRYNEWANRRMIDTLWGEDCPRAIAILAHLITTENEYFDRLSGKDSTGFNFWPEITFDKIEEAADRSARQYRDLLTGCTEEVLNKLARYKTSAGAEHENTYRELLTHVVMHSAIHRGNIMLKLRESGIEPPQIDYIIYLRQGN